MNDLNTQQIVLLCLLVSFVTAIATGITSVSLLNQSPQPVTQTINRVVEKTVETIIEQTENPKEPTIERVVETVVVNQEDLTVEAVEKSSKNLVRIFRIDRFGNEVFAGLGLVINATGKIIVPSFVVQLDSEHIVHYETNIFKLSKVGEANNGIVTFQALDIGQTTFVPAVFGDSQSLKLAQSVIVLSGQKSNIVSAGIITGLVTATGDVPEGEITPSTVPIEVLTQINTSVDTSVVSSGSILLNLKGEIVGIRTSKETLAGSFSPSNSVKGLIN